jgi:hypothetical protein
VSVGQLFACSAKELSRGARKAAFDTLRQGMACCAHSSMGICHAVRVDEGGALPGMLSGVEGEDVSEEHAQMLLDAGAGAQAAAGAKRKVCLVEMLVEQRFP